MSVPSLEGRFAIVTGASSPGGIGRAIARRFAREGASVLLVAEGTQAQLDDAQALCAAEGGSGRIEVLPIDLSLPEGPASMIDAAVRLFGRVDILINNAAARASVPFGDYTRAQFDHVVAVNLAAPFFASQAVLPLMRRQGGGRIIHIASQLGHVTYPSRALYGLTKAALWHATKTLAQALAPHIRVNGVGPGPTLASIHQDASEFAAEAAHTLLQKPADPQQIAQAVLYLIDASSVTGQMIAVDGGQHLAWRTPDIIGD